MLTPQEVQAMIEAVVPCEHIEVEGDGHHFFAVIVSAAFEGKARLARHRLIKDGLAEKLARAGHAVTLVTPYLQVSCWTVYTDEQGFVQDRLMALNGSRSNDFYRRCGFRAVAADALDTVHEWDATIP